MASLRYAVWGYWIRSRFKIILCTYKCRHYWCPNNHILLWWPLPLFWLHMLLFWLNIFLISFSLSIILLPSSWFHCLRKMEKKKGKTLFWIRKTHRQNELKKRQRSTNPSYGLHIQKGEQNTILAGPQFVPSNTEYQVLNNIECDFGFIIRAVRNEITRHIVICVRSSYVVTYILYYFILDFDFPYWPIEIVHALVYIAFKLNRLVCSVRESKI